MFNAYDAVKSIYDMKVGWHTSDKAGDKAKADEYAKNAQQYYKQVMDNGYSDVADALKNTNDVGAKYIVDNFMKTYSAPVDTSKSSTPTATADLTKADGMTTDLYGVQRADKDTLSKKYDTAEDYIYNYDHTKSATGKAILDNYKFQGETARDNATASGGASNGGNIDSYAAANANRQQLAYTNAGMNAVLNDFNSRISGIRGLLSDMGINLQNQYKSMQDTIGLKQTEEQRQFNNEETSKNNDVDRNVKISEVTGYVPEKWSYSNNFYLDENGNLKPEYENVDFSAVMAEAKKNGNTELYNQASIARAKKIYGNYAKYGKYDDGNYTLAGRQQTESSRRFDKEVDTNKAISDNTLATEERMNTDDNATTKYTSDNTLEGTKHTNNTNERIASESNATSIAVADINNKSAKEIAELEAQAVSNPTWQDVTKGVSGISKDAQTFLNVVVYSMWANEEHKDVTDVFAEALYDAKTNPNGYKITKHDASEIISNVFGSENLFNTTAEYQKWMNSLNWYNPDEDKTSDEDIDNAVENMK